MPCPHLIDYAIDYVIVTWQLLMLVLAKGSSTHLLMYVIVAVLALLYWLLARCGQLQCVSLLAHCQESLAAVAILLIASLLFLELPTRSGILQQAAKALSVTGACGHIAAAGLLEHSTFLCIYSILLLYCAVQSVLMHIFSLAVSAAALLEQET